MVSPEPYKASFGNSLDDVAAPGVRAVAQDRLVSQPVRFVRDSGRVAAKNAAMMLPVVSRSAPTAQRPTGADAPAVSSRVSFLRGRRPELKYAPSTRTRGFMAGR